MLSEQGNLSATVTATAESQVDLTLWLGNCEIVDGHELVTALA